MKSFLSACENKLQTEASDASVGSRTVEDTGAQPSQREGTDVGSRSAETVSARASRFRIFSAVPSEQPSPTSDEAEGPDDLWKKALLPNRDLTILDAVGLSVEITRSETRPMIPAISFTTFSFSLMIFLLCCFTNTQLINATAQM